MQVDSYYLQIHLWKFASDEKYVHKFCVVQLSNRFISRIIVNLIDDVIISTKKRCLEPISMEKSVSFTCRIIESDWLRIFTGNREHLRKCIMYFLEDVSNVFQLYNITINKKWALLQRRIFLVGRFEIAVNWSILAGFIFILIVFPGKQMMKIPDIIKIRFTNYS